MSGSVFTCITCQVAFADADLQRMHYKTDWHRYNLKRKVANLPHVAAEGFNQRVLAQRAQVCPLYVKSDLPTYMLMCIGVCGSVGLYGAMPYGIICFDWLLFL